MADPSYIDMPTTPYTMQFNDPPRSYQVEHITIGFSDPINLESLKEFFSNSLMLKIPRFSSLLINHSWRKTRVDIDQHVTIIRHHFSEEDLEDRVNAYLAELATALPMCPNKPLWEIHALVDLNCVVLRIHHAIGDGVSLLSLLREIGGACGGGDTTRRSEVAKRKSGGGFWRYVWNSGVFCVGVLVKFVVRDKKTVLNDGVDWVDGRPHKVATAKFSIDDVKRVKKVVPNATINDVMCGIIWGGFLKYVNTIPSTDNYPPPKEGQQITGLLMVNLRVPPPLLEVSKLMEEGSLESYWGNKFGLLLLPLYYTKSVANPIDYVRKAKFILDRKKHSFEPQLPPLLRNILLRLFGVKMMSKILNRGLNNVTFGFSNMVGPSEPISIAGNHVKYLKFSSSNFPMGIMMHLVSYTNNLNLQILAPQDVIPDPKILATCFEDTLQEMIEIVDRQGF